MVVPILSSTACPSLVPSCCRCCFERSNKITQPETERRQKKKLSHVSLVSRPSLSLSRPCVCVCTFFFVSFGVSGRAMTGPALPDAQPVRGGDVRGLEDGPQQRAQELGRVLPTLGRREGRDRGLHRPAPRAGGVCVRAGGGAQRPDLYMPSTSLIPAVFADKQTCIPLCGAIHVFALVHRIVLLLCIRGISRPRWTGFICCSRTLFCLVLVLFFFCGDGCELWGMCCIPKRRPRPRPATSCAGQGSCTFTYFLFGFRGRSISFLSALCHAINQSNGAECELTTLAGKRTHVYRGGAVCVVLFPPRS